MPELPPRSKQQDEQSADSGRYMKASGGSCEPRKKYQEPTAAAY